MKKKLFSSSVLLAAVLIAATLIASGLLAWAVSSSIESSSIKAQRIAETNRNQQELAIAKQQTTIAQQQISLQNALLGECSGINSLITVIDDTHVALHHAFLQAADIIAWSQIHVPKKSPALKMAESALRQQYLDNAAAVKGITHVDCAQELANPLSYSKAHAIGIK